MKIKSGFTLAEVMIVLTVIGILAGILIPVANNSRPDENVMKFKKANATLANVIHELVTSDKYYKDGDLGKRNNGDYIDGTHSGDKSYFCNTFADVLSIKTTNCNELESKSPSETGNQVITITTGITGAWWANPKTKFDEWCKEPATTKQCTGNVTTTDDITYFFIASCHPFGAYQGKILEQGKTWEAETNYPRINEEYNEFGALTIYKVFCIDIDGTPNSELENCDDIKDICPFGYGIRADGKILTGARADEWLEKGFQKGKKDN